jgi:hypothetical protein
MTEPTNSDFKLKLRTSKVEEKIVKKEEKEEKFTNILFSGLIFFTVVGTAMIGQALKGFREDLMNRNPNYHFPQYSDFYMCAVIVVVLIVSKRSYELII